MNSNTNFEDNIRRPDESYMDTLIPRYPPTFRPVIHQINETPQTIKIKKNKKNKKPYNPPILSTPRFMPEETKDKRREYFEENQTNKKQGEIMRNLSEEEIIKQSLLEYEELQRKQEQEMEEEMMRLSILEYEELQRKQAKELEEENARKKKEAEELLVRQNTFSKTKILMAKLKTIDKEENFYDNILTYITCYENDNISVLKIPEDCYQKFLKIINGVRIPENEKNALFEFIVSI